MRSIGVVGFLFPKASSFQCSGYQPTIGQWGRGHSRKVWQGDHRASGEGGLNISPTELFCFLPLADAASQHGEGFQLWSSEMSAHSSWHIEVQMLCALICTFVQVNAIWNATSKCHLKAVGLTSKLAWTELGYTSPINILSLAPSTYCVLTNSPATKRKKNKPWFKNMEGWEPEV